MVKCYTCEKGNLKNKKVKYTIYGVEVGTYPAKVCDKCGEVFFNEETSKKITEKTKKLGLWGLESRSKIGAAGTTLDLRFNKKLIDFFKLRKGQEVSMHPRDKESMIVELKK